MATKMKVFVMQGIGKIGFAEKPVLHTGLNDAVIFKDFDKAFNLIESKQDDIFKPPVSF